MNERYQQTKEALKNPKSKREMFVKKRERISLAIEKGIIGDGKFDQEEFSEWIQGMSAREKAERLREDIMSLIWSRNIIRQEKREGDGKNKIELAEINKEVDQDIIQEIRALWSDEEVRSSFANDFAGMMVRTTEMHVSDLGKKWSSLNKEIKRKEEDFQELERDIFLKKISRPDQLISAKRKAERLAKNLIRMRTERERILSLDGLEKTTENTNIAAQINYEKLKTYQEQLKTGFVWLPSREEIHRKTIASLQNGRWPVLVGEAGSGKSEQADAAAWALTGEMPTHIPCNERTNEKNLIADKEISASGKSYEAYGPAMQAATGYENSLQEKPTFASGRIVRFDESGRLGSQGYSIVKELRQKKAGDDLHGKRVLPGFGSIWTTNPAGIRYPDRQEPDPAMRRELAYIEVDYPSMTAENPELFEFMLAALLDEQGRIKINHGEIAPKFSDENKVIEDSTDKQHGFLYRLSFALKAIQDAFVAGNQEKNPENLLRFKDNNGKIVVSKTEGEPLTLSTSTVTLGEIAGWLRGYNERLQKAGSEFQAETFFDWMQYKLRTYLDQVDEDDRKKIEGIFEYFNLNSKNEFDKKTDSEMVSELAIGYLSPRVPRPIKKTEDEGSPAGEADPRIPNYENTQAMLEDGTLAFFKDFSWQFQKDGKKITMKKGKVFSLNGEKMRFAGVLDDKEKNSDGKKMVVFPISENRDEELGRILEKEEIESGEFPKMSVEIAQEIMEQNGKEFFLGPDDIEQSFGFKLKPEQIPEIPFSQEEIERHQGLGDILVLNVDKTSEGIPLTIQEMAQRAIKIIGSNVIEKDTNGNPSKYILYNGQFDENGNILTGAWFSGDPKVLSQTPKAGWQFVSPSILPDSTSKNYLAQTELLIENAKTNFFGGVLPPEYQMAENEFKQKKAEIEEFITDSNYVEATKILTALGITELLREPIQNTIFRYLVSYKKGTQLFTDGKYSWSGDASSVGGLLSFGGADANGANVDRGSSDNAWTNMGVVSSRF